MLTDPLPELTEHQRARIRSLQARLPELLEGAFWERRLHWAEAHAATRNLPEIIRTARAFAAVLDGMTVEIGPGELIVGRHPKSEPPPDMQERIDRANAIWGGDGLGQWAWAQMPEEARRLMAHGLFNSSSKTGHMTPDYPGLLRGGLGERVRQVRARLAALDVGAPDAGEQHAFLEAALTACEAASRFALRYAALAQSLAEEEADPTRREELRTIAGVCRQIAQGPARSFHEALQLAWFLHLWLCIENGEAAGAFAPGRVDQYLLPYFSGDLSTGALTEGDAYELLLCYWLKFSEICYQAVQSAVIGGTTPQGADACNRLTHLCLAAAHELRTLEPALVLRVSPQTPRCVLQQAAQLLRTGIGFPQFYNDQVTVACLERAGCAPEHAREYCIGGCVELTVQGMSNPWVGNFFNLTKCLLLALNEGVCLTTGERLGCETPPLRDITTFEQFWEAYLAQVRYCLRWMVYCENVHDRAQAQCTPYPMLSANILDCIANARDISAGGARYNFTELQGVGIANTADSLAAIRKFCFEERALSLEGLVDALRTDFEGAEDLRQALLHNAPKYGNGDPETDELARRIVEAFVAEVEQYENPRGGRFRAGLLVWDRADATGEQTGATPDGRRAGTVLADCIGPAQGRDSEGPTTVIRSATRFSHEPIVGGLVLNLKFAPASLASDASREKFIDLLRGYFDLGGMQMQVNVVDDALLRRAQECPEQYQDLAVRVSGWSAKFLRLSKRLQDEIISRTSQEL